MTTSSNQPIWQLLRKALDELPDEFTPARAIEWFESRGHAYHRGSIRAHIHSLAANRPQNASSKVPPGGEAFLYRVRQGVYTRFRPEIHSAVISPDQAYDEDDSPAVAEESAAEFALEMHLEEFLEANWGQISFGRPIDIWTGEDDVDGRQFPTDIGRLDFLCVDRADGSYVVVELKKGKTSDQVVGQTQRYMGWIRQNLAESGQGVRGLIIAHEADDKIKYALSEAPNIDLMTYEVSFVLNAAGLEVSGASGDG